MSKMVCYHYNHFLLSLLHRYILWFGIPLTFIHVLNLFIDMVCIIQGNIIISNQNLITLIHFKCIYQVKPE